MSNTSPNTSSEKKWYITVERNNSGIRGIFTDFHGVGFWRTEEEGQHTDDQMGEAVGLFWIVLDPKSVLISADELRNYNRFIPLGEFKGVYGIAVTTEQAIKYDVQRLPKAS